MRRPNSRDIAFMLIIAMLIMTIAFLRYKITRAKARISQKFCEIRHKKHFRTKDIRVHTFGIFDGGVIELFYCPICERTVEKRVPWATKAK